MITECFEQLKKKPSAVICAVGGGGLMCGVLEGLHNVPLKNILNSTKCILLSIKMSLE
jgi:L-serine/L-threonine ammonia-lyase